MTLSSEQAELLKNGSPLSLTVEQTSCILVRRDVFENLCASRCDDSDWTDNEMSGMAARMFDDLDRPELIV